MNLLFCQKLLIGLLTTLLLSAGLFPVSEGTGKQLFRAVKELTQFRNMMRAVTLSTEESVCWSFELSESEAFRKASKFHPETMFAVIPAPLAPLQPSRVFADRHPLVKSLYQRFSTKAVPARAGPDSSCA